MMREGFFGFYGIDADWLADLWRDGLMVLDANVILDLYRMEPEQAKEAFELFKSQRGRLWVPHQAALEYRRNLEPAVLAQAKLCEVRAEEMRKQLTRLKEEASQARSYPFVPKALLEGLTQSTQQVIKHLKEDATRLRKLVAPGGLKDEIATVFKGLVGPPFDDSMRSAAETEARRRHEQQIPPGFADAEKNNGGLGDYLLWSQTLLHAKTLSSHVIFVTNDRKPDWFRSVDGTEPVPHPELVQEFQRVTGRKFYAYDLAGFLRTAQKQLRTTTTAATIEEAARIRLVPMPSTA